MFDLNSFLRFIEISVIPFVFRLNLLLQSWILSTHCELLNCIKLLLLYREGCLVRPCIGLVSFRSTIDYTLDLVLWLNSISSTMPNWMCKNGAVHNNCYREIGQFLKDAGCGYWGLAAEW